MAATGLTVFGVSLGVAVLVALIQENEGWLKNVNLPFGFSIPLLIASIGAGVLVFMNQGVTGIAEQTARIVLFSGVTLVLVDRLLKRKV